MVGALRISYQAQGASDGEEVLMRTACLPHFPAFCGMRKYRNETDSELTDAVIERFSSSGVCVASASTEW